jgi:hypothetical protein
MVSFAPMPRAELVYANVLDGRVYDAEGIGGQPLVYTFAAPGRAFPFAVVRQWKAPQGVVIEHFELISPSGEKAYTSPPRVRRMPGQMDLTEIVDRVDDCVFPELGVYLVSFLIDGEVQGQVEFQVVFQMASEKLAKEVEEGFRKTDVVWIGIERDGADEVIPAWFAFQKGKVYVLHATNEAADEQRIPGADEGTDLLVISRHKYRDTRLNRFPVTCRVIPPSSPEFDQFAAALADRRRDRHGAPQEAIASWKKDCVILELTPNV